MTMTETRSTRDMLCKVPEVTLYFWIIKIMATTVGETAADYLNVNLGFGLTGTSWVTGALLVAVLIYQLARKRYVPWLYWLTVILISIVGTLITDNLTDNMGVPLWISTVGFSIVLAIGVTSLYTFQVTEQARKLSDALAATELVLTREQHLTQIDGLAAAAAHELGTPLSTIFLISRELEKALQENGAAQDPQRLSGDLKILREQAQRCRDILAKIAQLSSSGAPFDRMPLSTLIEETVAPHRDFGIDIKTRIAVTGASEPVGMRNPAILYGVGNILENAVDFARTTVEVNAWWNDKTVEILISDDGPGIAPDVLKRIGEPYLSRRRGADEAQEGRTGLGLGIFIARTLLERTGAKVSFGNRTFPEHGAVVQIVWPRSRFEVSEATEVPETIEEPMT